MLKRNWQVSISEFQCGNTHVMKRFEESLEHSSCLFQNGAFQNIYAEQGTLPDPNHQHHLMNSNFINFSHKRIADTFGTQYFNNDFEKRLQQNCLAQKVESNEVKNCNLNDADILYENDQFLSCDERNPLEDSVEEKSYKHHKRSKSLERSHSKKHKNPFCSGCINHKKGEENNGRHKISSDSYGPAVRNFNPMTHQNCESCFPQTNYLPKSPYCNEFPCGSNWHAPMPSFNIQPLFQSAKNVGGECVNDYYKCCNCPIPAMAFC